MDEYSSSLHLPTTVALSASILRLAPSQSYNFRSKEFNIIFIFEELSTLICYYRSKYTYIHIHIYVIL